jgi:prevent-host-death family protein
LKIYTFSNARQNFASVLDAAQKEGSVRITRRDGQVFSVQPVKSTRSPLDVPGVDLNISSDEWLSAIHEGRRAF